MATEDPGKFATIAFGLLPRHVFVQVAQTAPAGLTADEYVEFRDVLDAIQEAKLGDVPPAELFAGISTCLWSSFARPVELIEHAPLAVSPPPH